jgi:NitT/TauT family transport system substrate-binding protein
VYGEPFGRPEEIYKDFVDGKADTVILREPEASYAVKIMQDRGESFSVLPYSELWNSVNEGFGSFPNAGLVFNGEFDREHPDTAKMFLEELKIAVDCVVNNKKEAAKLSFDLMRQPVDRIELFLERVHFEYVEGDKMLYKIKQYFETLNKNGVTDINIDQEFMDVFSLDS